MSIDQGDKDRATFAEGEIKTASTVGVAGLCGAVMTPSQYAPGFSPTLGQDNNRATAVGVIEAMRSFPVRLPAYTVSTVPDASTAGAGALIFVSNGGAGSPIVAFSDGASWLRCDTGTAIS